MSAYYVNKICYLAQTDPAFRQALREHPAEAIADFRLTSEEQEALLEGDVATLHRLGAHDFLLGMLPRFELLGLTREVYQARMHTLLSHPAP